jgi:hypothetical protein
VHVQPPAAGTAQRAACRALERALPRTLEHLQARPTTPTSGLTAAWGDPPVVLRCGVGLPAGFTTGASLTQVNDVAWFQQVVDARVLWTTVDRITQVELTVPTSYDGQGAFLVDLADPIKRSVPLPAQQPR